MSGLEQLRLKSNESRFDFLFLDSFGSSIEGEEEELVEEVDLRLIEALALS